VAYPLIFCLCFPSMLKGIFMGENKTILVKLYIKKICYTIPVLIDKKKRS